MSIKNSVNFDTIIATLERDIAALGEMLELCDAERVELENLDETEARLNAALDLGSHESLQEVHAFMKEVDELLK